MTTSKRLAQWSLFYAIVMLLFFLPAAWLRDVRWLAAAGLGSFVVFWWLFRDQWRPLGWGGGPANAVTWLRLLGLVAMALLHPWVYPDPLCFWVLMLLGLDGLDGWIARKTHTSSELGAIFDKEVDALYVLVAAFLLWERGRLGAWVWIAGLWRYLYLVLRKVFPRPEQSAPEPRSQLGRYLAGGLMASLVAAFILPPPWRGALMFLATLGISFSFGRSLYFYWNPEQRPASEKEWWQSPLGRNVTFCLVVLALNLGLQLPQYLAFRKLYDQPPGSSLIWDGDDLSIVPPAELTSDVVSQPPSWWIRNQNDMGRISVELMIWVSLLLLLRRRPLAFRWTLWMGGGLMVLLLLFSVYYAFYTSVYGRHPELWPDLQWAWEVLPIFLGQILQSPWMLILGVLLGLGAIGGVFYLLIQGLKFGLSAEPRGWSRYGIGVLTLVACLSLLSTFTYWRKWPSFKDHYLTFRPMLPDFLRSLQSKPQPEEPLHRRLVTYYDYFDHPLTERPDVYLICIESYGQLLLADPRFKSHTYELLSEAEAKLGQAGWRAASGLSHSPVAGGGSWMAFSSAMLGVTISSQPQFRSIVESGVKFPSMVSFFNQAGYQTVRMKTMQDVDLSVARTKSYSEVNRLFGFQRWIKHRDFPYQGFAYDYFGGVPDQYALNYFQSELAPVDSPTFLFTITMNSHHPWFLTPPVKDNWRELDQIQANPDPRAPKDAAIDQDWHALTPGENTDRYAESIDYEWQMLLDFVLHRIDSQSIVILLGDHQPGVITDYDIYTKQTPIHILSQDASLLSYFQSEGLRPGLQVALTDTPDLHHAGIYSLLLRGFLKRYGRADTISKLTWYPDGV
ncbi:MAG: CDP-alcohol phosphatidyltransferase family protein [Bacteroidota bacterium]